MSANGEDGAAPQKLWEESTTGIVREVASHGERLTTLDRAVVNVLGRSEQQTNLLLEIKSLVVGQGVSLENLGDRLSGHIADSVTRAGQLQVQVDHLRDHVAEERGGDKVRGGLWKGFGFPVLVGAVGAVMTIAGFGVLYLVTRGGR